MIVRSFYLSDESNIEEASILTELSADEIEDLVGRFSRQSQRRGQLRGEVVVYSTGKIEIRHHFTKKQIWENELLAGFEDLDERF